MRYCPHLNVVGRRLPPKMSSRLVKMRNSKGSEGGGETSSTKSVETAQNVIQIMHKVVRETVAVTFFQEVRDWLLRAWLLRSFDCVAPALKKLPRRVRCLERNGC
jgi:hypothetical protein